MTGHNKPSICSQLHHCALVLPESAKGSEPGVGVGVIVWVGVSWTGLEVSVGVSSALSALQLKNLIRQHRTNVQITY